MHVPVVGLPLVDLSVATLGVGIGSGCSGGGCCPIPVHAIVVVHVIVVVIELNSWTETTSQRPKSAYARRNVPEIPHSITIPCTGRTGCAGTTLTILEIRW